MSVFVRHNELIQPKKSRRQRNTYVGITREWQYFCLTTELFLFSYYRIILGLAPPLRVHLLKEYQWFGIFFFFFTLRCFPFTYSHVTHLTILHIRLFFFSPKASCHNWPPLFFTSFPLPRSNSLVVWSFRACGLFFFCYCRKRPPNALWKALTLPASPPGKRERKTWKRMKGDTIVSKADLRYTLYLSKSKWNRSSSQYSLRKISLITFAVISSLFWTSFSVAASPGFSLLSPLSLSLSYNA